MTITTSKGKIFEVNWAWAPVGFFNNRLQINYNDDRPLNQIAEDFIGCTYFDRQSENEGNKHWEGYNDLVGIIKEELHSGTVTVTLQKLGV